MILKYAAFEVHETTALSGIWEHSICNYLGPYSTCRPECLSHGPRFGSTSAAGPAEASWLVLGIFVILKDSAL